MEYIKTLTKLVVTCCFLLFVTSTAFGQETDSNKIHNDRRLVNIDTVEIELNKFLPPLAILIDSAKANSPEIDYYIARIRQQEYLISAERKKWIENFYINGSYGYGNQATFQINNSNTGGTINDSTNTTTTLGQAITSYQLGVGFRVPFDVFYGRKDKIRAVEASRESEVAKMKEMENLIVDKVITYYTSVSNKKRLLEIYSEAKESSEFILEMSEERFRDGEIGLDELGQNTELKAKWSALYENTRVEYSTEYAKLERLVGVPFSKFEN